MGKRAWPLRREGAGLKESREAHPVSAALGLFAKSLRAPSVFSWWSGSSFCSSCVLLFGYGLSRCMYTLSDGERNNSNAD